MKEENIEEIKLSAKLEDKEATPVLKEIPEEDSEAHNQLSLVENEEPEKEIENSSDSEESLSIPPEEAPAKKLLDKYNLPGLLVPLVATLLFLISFLDMGVIGSVGLALSMFLAAGSWGWSSIKYQKIAYEAFPEDSRKHLLAPKALTSFRFLYGSIVIMFVTCILPRTRIDMVPWIPEWINLGLYALLFFWITFEMFWYMSMQSFIATMKAKPNSPPKLTKSIFSSLGYFFSSTLGATFYPLLIPFFANGIRNSFTEIMAKDYTVKASVEDKNKKVIRYRRFATIEKWLSQRFTSGKKDKNRKLKFALAFLLAPLLIGLGFYGSFQIWGMLSDLISQIFPSGPENGPLPPTATGNFGVISSFLIFSGVSLWTMLLIYFMSPNYLEFSKKGIKFLRKSETLIKELSFLAWEQIEKITIENEGKSTGGSDSVLHFHKKDGSKPLKLNLNSIPTIEERQDILTAIEKFAPGIQRSSDVMLALQLPAEHSYTELWLQALAAPPKREKLQPLTAGLSLRDGRYEVIRKLGAGGQGFAYLAKDTNSDEIVVLKEFILPVFVDINVRKAALEAFEGEARILGNLDHPQIVKLLDFMVEDHRAYLVLEHIDGKSLREIVKEKGKLNESETRDLAKQMCTVLENLHAQSPPVVHRDFTPDNLILKKDGTLKLIDFNVAQQSDSTTIAKVVGKQAYLPPEQFRGEPCPQSDIYAMGCTLHYLTTGKDPVPISQSNPKSLESHLSQNFNNIVARCTEVKLEKRYSDLEEIKNDLDSKDDVNLPPSDDEPEKELPKESDSKSSAQSTPELKESEPDTYLKETVEPAPPTVIPADEKVSSLIPGERRTPTPGAEFLEKVRLVLGASVSIASRLFLLVVLALMLWTLAPGLRPYLDPNFAYNKQSSASKVLVSELLYKDYIESESKIIDQFDKPVNYMHRAEAYFRIGQYQNCVQDMNHLIKMAPNVRWYRIALAKYHGAENNFKASKETVDSTFNDIKNIGSGQRATLHYLRANAVLHLPEHDIATAMEELVQSERAKRNLDRPRETLKGIAYEINGDAEAARTTFRRAIANKDRYFWSTGIPHDTRLLRKIHYRALDSALKTFSKQDSHIYATALGLYQVRDYARAKEFLNKLSSRASESELALSLQAQIALDSGDIKSAELLAEKILSRTPNAGHANFIKAKVLFSAGSYQSSISCLNNCIESGSAYKQEALLLRGKAYRMLGMFEAARVDFERCLKLSKLWPEADLLLGETLFNLNRFNNVVTRYEHPYYKYSWSVENWNFIGARMADLLSRSYSKLGDEIKAKEYRKIANQLGFVPKMPFDNNKPGLF